MILITGGAGFIGSNFVLDWFESSTEPVVNLDKLTYAGNPNNLKALAHNRLHTLIKGDIGDRVLVGDLLRQCRPRAIINFAAETHVDRSIRSPEPFVATNVVGTVGLLDEVYGYWRELESDDRESFRFIHISTDEVYGSLGADEPPASERAPYAPNSPYAASKAASDHLVRAYERTYGLPTLITNCSNNYGPFQFPEKLIPLMIVNATRGAALPLYGDGRNIRDWIYVKDHCAAIRAVLERGAVGETYNIGADAGKTNIEVVSALCAILDRVRPRSATTPHAQLITYITDRPGHDRRYAIDSGKIRQCLGWQPRETFESGLEKTITWYLENDQWIESVTNGEYKEWVELHYRTSGKKI